MQAAPRDAATAQKLEDAQQRYQSHKEKFDRLRADVGVKMKFLDENRVRTRYIFKHKLINIMSE